MRFLYSLISLSALSIVGRVYAPAASFRADEQPPITGATQPIVTVGDNNVPDSTKSELSLRGPAVDSDLDYFGTVLSGSTDEPGTPLINDRSIYLIPSGLYTGGANAGSDLKRINTGTSFSINSDDLDQLNIKDDYALLVGRGTCDYGDYRTFKPKPFYSGRRSRTGPVFRISRSIVNSLDPGRSIDISVEKLPAEAQHYKIWVKTAPEVANGSWSMIQVDEKSGDVSNGSISVSESASSWLPYVPAAQPEPKYFVILGTVTVPDPQNSNQSLTLKIRPKVFCVNPNTRRNVEENSRDIEK